ncbi:MAG: type IV toxin-antitoxin system AbiEi family antitoxin domain-containing protein, partial [Solirubrobacterales bacterium]|nr:type IV toxin-antitoxin system AbiEi family antitoxin domain-containing protein [Solirubrobacterales bacterium]
MDEAGPKSTAYPTQSAPLPLDRAIGDRATCQHGVIALAQLVELGLCSSSVRDRVASGRLRRMHRGVYAVGHTALPPLGRVMAAVLACGPDAVASHRT